MSFLPEQTSTVRGLTPGLPTIVGRGADFMGLCNKWENWPDPEAVVGPRFSSLSQCNTGRHQCTRSRTARGHFVAFSGTLLKPPFLIEDFGRSPEATSQTDSDVDGPRGEEGLSARKSPQSKMSSRSVQTASFDLSRPGRSDSRCRFRVLRMQDLGLRGFWTFGLQDPGPEPGWTSVEFF